MGSSTRNALAHASLMFNLLSFFFLIFQFFFTLNLLADTYEVVTVFERYLCYGLNTD